MRVGLRLAYFRYTQKWVLLGVIIGVIGGLGTAIFYWLLELSTNFFLNIIPANLGNSWITVLMPALGGLIAGPIIYLLAPEAEGHGTDAVISVYHENWGNIRTRVPNYKNYSLLTNYRFWWKWRSFCTITLHRSYAWWSIRTNILHVFPEMVTQPEIFALVGMAAFFAGAAKVPIASIIMISEMTSGYSLLVPLMLASAISYALSGEASIYESQQSRRESF